MCVCVCVRARERERERDGCFALVVLLLSYGCWFSVSPSSGAGDLTVVVTFPGHTNLLFNILINVYKKYILHFILTITVPSEDKLY